jgi:flagellar assembly factor FliW
MKVEVNTRLFGKIDIDDSKIITLDKGIIGFPDLKQFTLIFDSEKENDGTPGIMWFQSMDEPQFAMPVIIPNYVVPDYNPIVNDELLNGLGELNEKNIYVITTISVPEDIKNMTINLKAPIVINTETLKGAQIIVENEDALVRFPVYDILKAAKEGKD